MFTEAWGSRDRRRAVCGTDGDREAGCSRNVREIRVGRDGRVTSAYDAPGVGSVNPHETALLGRGAGADTLRKLAPGDYVDQLHYRLVSTGGAKPVSALGGMPIVRNGRAIVPDMSGDERAPRTAVGFNKARTRLFMVTVADVTIAQLADLMIREFGSDSVVNFDGGGSSTLGTRGDDGKVQVRNDPTDVLGQRSVANALAVYSKDKRISHLAGAWAPYATDSGPAVSVDETGHVQASDLIEADGTRHPGRYTGTLTVDRKSTADAWHYTARMRPTTPGTSVPFTLRLSTDHGTRTLVSHGAGGTTTYVRY